MAAVAARQDKFDELAVQVFSISVDSVQVHKMWVEQELNHLVEKGIRFPMISDTAGRIGKAYGVYYEPDGSDLRGTFIISPEGKIRYMEVLTASVGRNLDETVRLVQGLQRVRESRGTEVCPAGWMPGDPTLRPSVDLEGKVWTIWKAENKERK